MFKRLCNLACALLRYQEKEADAVFLILGGARQRELECAAIRGRQNYDGVSAPKLLLLSSGCASTADLVHASGLRPSLIRLDNRAVDTLTNFTTLAFDLACSECTSILVATSEAHMRRAYPLAFIVLGSYGIQVSRLTCPDTFDGHAQEESTIRRVRDLVRALIWVVTGWDGRGVSAFVHPDRQRATKDAMSNSNKQLPWPSLASRRLSSLKAA
mmetsp:Transcript_30392/g.61870  ORF Transcript_30392/g.61870 Transcript_30392/m.61870 type:complete len:214 (+) Transcript_30392:91-732(+)